MERDQLILIGLVVVVVLFIAVILISLTGNNTFQKGNIYFEYPNSWAEEHQTGDFENGTLFSQLTLSTNVQNSAGNTEPAYIIITKQMQSPGVLNIPSSGEIIANTTNSSVASIELDNFKATQIGSKSDQIAVKVTIIGYNNYYYIIQYICPTYALNTTETAYNTILNTLKIS